MANPEARLLELGNAEQLGKYLTNALALVVEVTRARHGYLEIRGPRSRDERVWQPAHSFDGDQLHEVRAAISRGVISQALVTGQTTLTRSAFLDDRYRERGAASSAACSRRPCWKRAGTSQRPRGASIWRGRTSTTRSVPSS